ncbi:MAG: hypothetical protein AAGH79_11445, partial [Bacteroidota bacterium]
MNRKCIFIWTLLALLVSSTGLQAQSYVFKSFSLSERFDAAEEESYYFNIDKLTEISMAKLVISGTDYDYDSDGDYTIMAIEINGEEVLYDEFTDHGMGKDGSYSDISIDIYSSLKSGSNTIKIINKETSGETDYVYLQDMKVKTNSLNSAKATEYTLYANSSKSLYERLEAQDEMVFDYYVASLSSISSAYFVIYGSDMDYDNDEDWTEVVLSVNGTDVKDVEAHELGMGKDGSNNYARVDITSYLKSGYNEIIFKDTEVSGQTDYVYISSVEIDVTSNASGSGQTLSYNLTTNSQKTISSRLNAQDEMTFSFNVSNASGLSKGDLVIYGSDIDEDNDEDWTEITLSVNGTEIKDAEAYELGLGKDGSNDYARIDIRDYLRSGNNTITFKDTEVASQTDYVYVSWAKVETATSSTANTSSSGVSSTVYLTPNAKKIVSKRLNAQDEISFQVTVNNLTSLGSADLEIYGSDYDYDNDGDFTEVYIYVTCTEVVDSEARSMGFGSNGTNGTARIDVLPYLQSGRNTIRLKEGETSGQTDYISVVNAQLTTGSSPSYSSSPSSS